MILIVLMVTPLDIYKQNMEKVLLKNTSGCYLHNYQNYSLKRLIEKLTLVRLEKPDAKPQS